MLLAFVIMISAMSCNTEELFIEPVGEEVINLEDEEEVLEEEVTEEDEEPEVDPTLPCEFDLNTIAPNSTILINCIMDLDGATISVPANVSILYDGGDIINGTLNFSDNGIISGELLNSSLTLVGSTPQLKDTTFNFDPKRWDIVEGETTSEIAFRNRDILEALMVQVKSMGATTFSIDEMDAYFEVGKLSSTAPGANFYPALEAITLPSDFHLLMTNNTHLRVYPNNTSKYALLGVYDSSNIKIEGGNLHGDRDKHDYSSGGAHEHGHCLQIRSGQDVLVENVRFSGGTGDGIDINSIGFSFQPNYKPSNNIHITNNIFDSNRRNNLSITDGFNIIIENNEFLNASQNTALSNGVAPGFAIDIEAVRGRDSDGNMIYYQISKDIIIRNNIERNSRVGAFTVHIGYSVIIENNTTEMPISFSFTDGTTIRGNTVTAKSGSVSGAGIIAGVPGDSETIYNNEVSNNTINGYPIGITVYNRDAKILENNINDFVSGIFIKDGSDLEISRNILKSSKNNSKGIFMSLTSLNNVLFSENSIDVTSNAFNFSNVNKEAGQENFKFTVENNTFSSANNAPCLINATKGLSLNKNAINSGIQVFNSESISFADNDIAAPNNHGIYLREVNKSISLRNNSIEVVGNYECIKTQNTTSSSEVVQTSNSCN